jgi:hypothetical protein
MGGMRALNQLRLTDYSLILRSHQLTQHTRFQRLVLRCEHKAIRLSLYRQFPRFGQMSVSIADGTGKLDAGVPSPSQNVNRRAEVPWTRNSRCLAPSSPP